MKNLIKPASLVFFILLCILNSCKKDELPLLTTASVTDITTTSSTSGGNITSDGGAGVIARGVCWSVTENPTISDSKTKDGNGIGQFLSSISGLNGGSTYHIRAYATNSVGTAYGSDMTFITLGQSPVATTLPVCCITTTGVTLNGIVNANDLSTTVVFEYGTTTTYDSSVDAVPSPVTGNDSTSVSASISGLNFGTTYHFRIKAVNALGTSNGIDFSFTTLSQAPTASTLPACCPTANGAKLNGIVNANYLPTTVSFEYGRSQAYGSSVAAAPSPVAGNNTTSVSAVLSGLNSGTTYHFRIKAENAHGTIYGSDMSLTTLVIDKDGNIYNIVTIGSQVWMAENLKTTKYSNGEQLPNETDRIKWLNLSTGAYCWYNNSETIYKNAFGALYNWYAVQDSRNICPTGWHVPSTAEWTTLTSYLGGESVSGGKLKETGTTHWQSPNTSATNETGFTALPGGSRFYEMNSGIELFDGFGSYGYWWSVTGYSSAFAWYRSISYNSGNAVTYDEWKSDGFSVRCLKDN